MGCFPVDFQEAKRPLATTSVKRPIKVGKRPIKEGNGPLRPVVLVGTSVGCLMGCFRAPPPWRKTAPLKRPIKRSMIIDKDKAEDCTPNLLLRVLAFSLAFSFSRILLVTCDVFARYFFMAFLWLARGPSSNLDPSPNLEKKAFRLKSSVSFENFSISLVNFNRDLQRSPKKGAWGVARLNFQSRLKITFPEGDLELFQSVGLLGEDNHSHWKNHLVFAWQ